jgi:nuclear pore complex protein Nup155
VLTYESSALEDDANAQANADRIIAKVVPLGQRFCPSESAFPLRKGVQCSELASQTNLFFSLVFLGHIATLLVRFVLANKGILPYGWAPRVLVQCGVPYTEIWDVFHEMYESQVCHSARTYFQVSLMSE